MLIHFNVIRSVKNELIVIMWLYQNNILISLITCYLTYFFLIYGKQLIMDISEQDGVYIADIFLEIEIVCL